MTGAGLSASGDQINE